jgi:hypothetical protein
MPTKKNSVFRFVAIAVGLIFAVSRSRYPNADAFFRVVITLVPFGVILHVGWQWRRELWFWSTVLILLMIHVAVLCAYASIIFTVNIWLLGGGAFVEACTVGWVVASVSPESRAWRRKRKNDERDQLRRF